MEDNRKQVGGGSSASSSFTLDLFGPKDPPSPSSSTLFGSVFGPHSTGLGRNASHSRIIASKRKDDFRGQYGYARSGTSDDTSHRGGGGGKGESNGHSSDNKSSIYQSQSTVEPCYFSSSIHYGGQDQVYSPTSTQTSNVSQDFSKKDEADDDPNGSSSGSASRGNWWQGSLYY